MRLFGQSQKVNSAKLDFRFTEFSEVRIAPVQHLLASPAGIDATRRVLS
jgi:hypothetical protein